MKIYQNDLSEQAFRAWQKHNEKQLNLVFSTLSNVQNFDKFSLEVYTGRRNKETGKLKD